MNRKVIILAGVLLMLVLAACGLTPEQVDEAVSTVQSMSPSQLASLATTAQALPPEQIEALATSAAVAGYPTLSADQVNAVYATVESAKATATAVGHAASSGERVNATQVPAAAPQIIYFFASAPSQESMQAGMRYHLNYTVQNANRVEIFGNVMDNPQEGSFPIYNTPASDDWVLWAGNDQAWVEQFLQVRPDADTGTVLQNVTVNSNAITLTFRDPQFVDGDVIDVDVNGVRVLDRYVTQGRYVAFPITLNSGANTVTINARNVGVTPPNVTEIVVSNITSGPGSQVTRGLNQNETQSFTITAP